MALDLFGCPECKVMVRRSPQMTAGSLTSCPKCGHSFPVPPEASKPAAEEPPPPAEPAPQADERREAPAPSSAAPDGDRTPPARQEQEPPSVDEEEAEEDENQPSERAVPGGGPSSNYRISIGRWFGTAREHWMEVLFPAAGYLIVVAVVVAAMRWLMAFALGHLILASGGGEVSLLALPQQEAKGADLFLSQGIAGGLNLLLYTLWEAPLLAGLTVVALAQLKGEVWVFGEFFGGFRRYGTVAVLALVVQLGLLPAQLASTAGQHYARQAQPTEALLAQAAALGWLIAYVALWVRLMFFALPLVFDRGYGPLRAMAASWRMSRGHFWGLLGIGLLLVLINVAGLLTCGVGLLISMPFVELVFVSGYLLSGGTTPPVPLEYDPDEAPASRFRGIFGRGRRGE
jgi:hypothetical protein